MVTKSFFYDGREVSRELLEAAIDFLISIEPDPEVVVEYSDYEEITKKYEIEIKMAEAAIRHYGEQIEDKALANMQKEFYSITHLPKYRQSYIHQSVAHTVLNSQWHGIGPWKK